MIFRSPEPDREIPDVALTPLLLERAAARGDKPALIDGPTGRTLTYSGWVDGVRRTAAGLSARGFRRGDVFAIYSPNVPEYAIAFHAVSLLGGIVTTINPAYTQTELGQQLKDSGARALVTVPPCADKAAQAAREAGVREVFVFGESEGATPFVELMLADGEPPTVSLDPATQVVVLPYSSGTTGLPKGVMLTHRNLVANMIQSECALTIGESDTILGVLPFFHIYGMVVIMNCGLYAGSTIVTMPRFDFEQCLKIIEQYRITFANVVPPIVLALAKSPLVDKYDLHHLHTVFSGAAPLGEQLAAAASARLGCRVFQGYGLTETSPVTHAMRGACSTNLASIGPAVPNTEVRIVDVTTGAELGPGENGEICIRGPQVMKGYLNQPEATAAMIDADGWLRTGDIGYADENGCFFIVDRLKELIKYKGMQIAPAELEAVLLSHPLIADAAVIPVANDECGEVPKAFVVLRGDLRDEAIVAYVAGKVAPYKKLREVEVIDQIPKSPSGKILRRVLVERERARVKTHALVHPLTGNWKASLEKSRRHANHQFQEATMRIAVDGTEVRIGYGGVNASGKDEAGTQAIDADGKDHAHPQAPGLVTTAILDPYSVTITAKQGGTVVGGGRYEVSSDGRTMTATVSGVDASGKAFDQVIVFDRL